MNDDANIPGFIDQFKPGFPVGRADRVNVGAYMQFSPMMRTYVPFLVIIDRKGAIQEQYSGSDPVLSDESTQDAKLREVLARYLAPTPKVARKKAPNKPK